MTLSSASRISPEEERELYRMVKEIYCHLGLDTRKIVSMRSVKEQARKDVLKWQEKHREDK